MKVINIMNFVRQIDERMEDSLNVLYNTTKSELEMVNEYDLEAVKEKLADVMNYCILL